MVRIADPDLQRRELGLGLHLGFRRHPRKRVDTLCERADQVMHQILDVSFSLRWEVALYIKLADRIAEREVRVLYRTLPAVADSRRAAQHVPIEGEVLIHERLRQVVGSVVNGVKFQIRLPSLDRFACHERGSPLDCARLPNDELLLSRESRGAEVLMPVQPGRAAAELLPAPMIIAALDVFRLSPGRMRLGDTQFKCKYGCSLPFGIRLAAQLEDGGDMRL